MVIKRRQLTLWIAGSIFIACHGIAVGQDIVTFRSGVTVMGDDNFLRSSPASSNSTERVTTQTLGLQVKLPVSRQNFTLDAGLTSNHHQTFSNFDYLAQNYRASMQWAASSLLQGSVGTSRSDTLNSAADSVNPELRNKNTSVSTNADFLYLLGGPWQLNGGLVTAASINERALVGQNTETRTNTARLGFSYSSSPGNVWAYSLNRSNGANVADFQSTGHGLSLQWVPTGNLSWTFGVNYSDQVYASAPQYNFSGYGGNIAMNWRLSGRLNLVADLQRTSSAYASATASSALIDAFSLAPAWEISSKSSLRLKYKYGTRVEQGNLSGIAGGRSDITQDLSLAYVWTPRQFASITASLAHAQRASSAVNQDYIARQLVVSALLSF